MRTMRTTGSIRAHPVAHRRHIGRRATVVGVAPATFDTIGDIGRHHRRGRRRRPDRRRRSVTWAVAVAALYSRLPGAPAHRQARRGPPRRRRWQRTAPAPTAASAPPAAADATPAGAPEVNPAGDIPDNQVFVPFTSPDNAARRCRCRRGGRAPRTAPRRCSPTSSTACASRSPPGPLRRTSPRPGPTDVPAAPGIGAGFALHDVRSVQRKGGTAVLVTYEATRRSTP